MNRTHRALAVLAAVATVCVVAGSTTATAALVPRSVTYSAYVQGRGWMAAVSNGATAGTVGKSLRVEAFKVSGINLTYRAHVQKIGWQAWVKSGAVAGTVGRSLRVEAMQVKSLDPQWRVEYRANVQGIGWQRWVSDGATAGTTGRALRLEAMQIRLIEKTPELTDTITFTATADNGLGTAAQGVFAGIGRSGANVGFVLGDLAYAADKEAAYCAMVNNRVNFPTMLLTGNHEGDGVNNGVLSRFTACLPSRLGQVGTYAKDYYVDRGPVRFIMISPNITLSGTMRTYRNGTPEQAWLRSTIRAAKAASQWTVVGMHEPCFSLGVHGCASSPELSDALIAEHVDLVAGRARPRLHPHPPAGRHGRRPAGRRRRRHHDARRRHGVRGRRQRRLRASDHHCQDRPLRRRLRDQHRRRDHVRVRQGRAHRQQPAVLVRAHLRGHPRRRVHHHRRRLRRNRPSSARGARDEPRSRSGHATRPGFAIMVRMLSRRFATIVTLLIVAAFVVVSVAPAFAATPTLLPQHAKLVGTTPKDGSSVETARVVTLTFSEDVNPDFVTVEVAGPSGAETDGDATTKGVTVTQPLTGDLAAGQHVVTYRVVSTDGHPVSGTVTFTTTAGPASASPSPSTSATPTPEPTASVVASPQPTVTAAPTSQESGGGIPGWLIIGGVVLLAALALGAAWRSIGGPEADAEEDAPDRADDATTVDPEGTHR